MIFKKFLDKSLNLNLNLKDLGEDFPVELYNLSVISDTFETEEEDKIKILKLFSEIENYADIFSTSYRLSVMNYMGIDFVLFSVNSKKYIIFESLNKKSLLTIIR